MKINKNQILLSNKWQALTFFISRGKGHLFRYLLNRLRWSWYPRLGYVSKFPDHIDIEITNNCNMNCPMCFRNIMFKEGVKPGYMSFDLFKKIIDEASKNKVFSVRLSWRGEPLIHPKLIDMIKYAKAKGIMEVSFLTNGLTLSGGLARELVRSGVDWITVSFDGLGTVYEKIRFPAKFSESVQRLKDFQAIKRKLKTKKPILKIQSIWSVIKDNPKEYYDTFKDFVDEIVTNPYKDHEGTDKIDHNPNFVCPQPWQRFVITWDGKVTQCICAYKEDRDCIIGDVNKQSISEIWHGKEFNRVRKLHKQKKRLELSCCRTCFDGAKKKKVKIRVGDRESKQYVFGKEYEKKVVALVQARMSSTRLLGKMMKKIGGKPMIFYLLEQLKHSKMIDKIVLVTSTLSENDVLADYVDSIGVEVFRGSEDDVLERFVDASVKYNANLIVRVTGDEPLIDPRIVDGVIKEHINLGVDYTSTIGYVNGVSIRTIPKGLDLEVFSRENLLKINNFSRTSYDKEHVTPFFYNNPSMFKIHVFKSKKELDKKIVLTVDDEEDFVFVKGIIEKLYREGKPILHDEVLEYVKSER